MSVIGRLTNFSPGDLIQSSDFNDEFNQLVNLLSGNGSPHEVYIVSNDLNQPTMVLQQQTTGPLQHWKRSSNLIASLNGDADFDCRALRLYKGTSLPGLAAPSATNTLLINHVTAAKTNAIASINAIGTANVPLDLQTDTGSTAYSLRTFESGDALERIRIGSRGKIETRAGNSPTGSPSNDFMSMAGSYYVDFSTINSSGGIETDLHSKIIGANVLNANGDWISIDVAGFTAGNANTKRIRFYFGGSVILDTGPTTAFNGLSWKGRIVIIRSSSNVARISAEFVANSSLIVSFANVVDVGSLNFAGILISKVTGQGVTNGDVNQLQTLMMKG